MKAMHGYYPLHAAAQVIEIYLTYNTKRILPKFKRVSPFRRIFQLMGMLLNAWELSLSSYKKNGWLLVFE
jgi:hypothetical protein